MTMFSSVRLIRHFSGRCGVIRFVYDHPLRAHYGFACWQFANEKRCFSENPRSNRILPKGYKLDVVPGNKKRAKNPFVAACYDELISDARYLSTNEWLQIGLKFKGTHVESHWPSVLLTYMMNMADVVPGLYELGISLVNFATENASSTSIDKFLLVATVSLSIHQGSPRELHKAYAAYEKLSSFGDLDWISAQILLNALSKTDKWKECFKLLEMIKKFAALGTLHYSPVLIAALQHGEVHVVNDIMLKMFKAQCVPNEKVFHTMLDLDQCVQLVEILEKFGWIPSLAVAKRIALYFKSRQALGNWRSQETIVDSNGQCKCCGLHLKPIPAISVEEFGELREAFMEKSLKRDGDIFLNSTPEELMQYHNFLSKHAAKPFDVVIDGLNIAHCTRQGASRQQKDTVLFKVINHFAQKGNRVLVIGREHMNNWKSAKYKGVVWFYTSNISADDPYMLHAAMHSGLNTYLVSNDQMRDARFLLGDKLSERFKQWQKRRQIKLPSFWHSGNTGITVTQVDLTYPGVHDTVVQSTNNAIHIPVLLEAATIWICLRRTIADDQDKDDGQKTE